jgi:hypothetical protein
MELRPSWEAASCVASEEFPNILWNPTVSLPCSQTPSTGPYPKLDQSISYNHSSSPQFMLHALPITSSLNYLLIMLGEGYKLWRSSICSFLQRSVTLFLFGPNILLSTLFSNILSLWSSLNVRDQVPHQYRTIGKIQSSGWLDIHFTVGISCERAAPLAKKNVTREALPTEKFDKHE